MLDSIGAFWEVKKKQGFGCNVLSICDILWSKLNMIWAFGAPVGIKITIDYRPKKSLKNRKMLNIIGAFWEEKYTGKSNFTQIGNNSLNNGVRAVLTVYLDF